MNHLEIKDLNLVDYIDAWDLMKSNVSLRSATDQDEVWLAEHNPVYTVESSVTICDDPAMKVKKIVCKGDGSSIKCAEQSAAKFILEKLRSLDLKKSF